ncbi:hypothetical protein [Flagellimonas allohymeniacidonis]|uniref:DUF4374 domain-containing protein n=1 Tax=Flagellimonas allohymeniacidonis TaxID=2517819 RepID=A0A4Q8Q8Z4_9FLAO|nr:hypothetical protein [Allomuricauda hymeniacidonis]TAI46661.1 hypothetical protein EW142_16425 [Allomuricauda hymeniacidonis]
MKKLLTTFSLVAIILVTIAATITDTKSDLKAGFVVGNPEIESMDKLSFGPEGILFIGDTKKASVYAVDTKDVVPKEEGGEIAIKGFDQKIAASLGTTTDKIKINDMAVNPISKNVYFSVNVMDGTPVILRLKGEGFENVPVNDVSYSKIELNDVIASDAKDKWDRDLRIWAISDLMYHNGKVLISGLSNKEFGSTFRSIPFPFNDAQEYASLEIWHAAHGAYETHAPIKTFDVININNQDYLMASYTCTPLVLFPMSDLKDGTHTKGRTVAELGAGNSPLDMISYEKNGQKYFLMSNTNRPVMRIKYKDIASFDKTLTEPVTVFAETEGVPYDNLPFPYVLQMDNLDATNVVYLQRTSNGDLILRSRSIEWM